MDTRDSLRYYSTSEVDEERNDQPFSWKSKIFQEELKINIKMALPVLITNVMQYIITLETMSICGRLSTTEVEAVGFALSLISALGWCICNGMVTACDTMFAQAFGSDDKKRTGLFLQRGLLMLNLVPIFLWGIHLNLEPVLILLGQNAEISRVTGEFIVIFTPGLVFMMNYLIFARFMQDQGCLWPPVIAGLFGNVFNVSSQLFFVIYLGYGFRASAICHMLSYGVMVLCELIYVFKTKFYAATWPGFQLEALYDWSHMFKLSLAGTGQVAFEVIIWEANIFMGGLLGPIQLATQSILLQIINIIFSLYMGAGIASNIRVGQCLGANKPNRAKAAYRAGLLTIGTCVTVMCILIISLHNYIPYIFTNKEEVIQKVIDSFPAIYLLLFVDPFSAICSAALRGCGRQALGGLIIFIGFYIFSLPSSILLAFVFKLDVKGLWIGTTIGSIISTSSIFFVLECQNWKKQAALAFERITYSSFLVDNKPSDVETKHLLYTLDVDEGIHQHKFIHIRTPSYPVSCATKIVELPKQRNQVIKTIIIQRILIAIAVLIFFLCGLFIHLYLPTEMYRPFNSSVVV